MEAVGVGKLQELADPAAARVDADAFHLQTEAVAAELKFDATVVASCCR